MRLVASNHDYDHTIHFTRHGRRCDRCGLEAWQSHPTGWTQYITGCLLRDACPGCTHGSAKRCLPRQLALPFEERPT